MPTTRALVLAASLLLGAAGRAAAPADRASPRAAEAAASSPAGLALQVEEATVAELQTGMAEARFTARQLAEA